MIKNKNFKKQNDSDIGEILNPEYYENYKKFRLKFQYNPHHTVRRYIRAIDDFLRSLNPNKIYYKKIIEELVADYQIVTEKFKTDPKKYAYCYCQYTKKLIKILGRKNQLYHQIINEAINELEPFAYSLSTLIDLYYEEDDYPYDENRRLLVPLDKRVISETMGFLLLKAGRKQEAYEYVYFFHFFPLKMSIADRFYGLIYCLFWFCSVFYQEGFFQPIYYGLFGQSTIATIKDPGKASTYFYLIDRQKDIVIEYQTSDQKMITTKLDIISNDLSPIKKNDIPIVYSIFEPTEAIPKNIMDNYSFIILTFFINIYFMALFIRCFRRN